MTNSLYVDNWYEVYEVHENGNKLLGWNVYAVPAKYYHKEMTEEMSEDVSAAPIFKANGKLVP